MLLLGFSVRQQRLESSQLLRSDQQASIHEERRRTVNAVGEGIAVIRGDDSSLRSPDVRPPCAVATLTLTQAA